MKKTGSFFVFLIFIFIILSIGCVSNKSKIFPEFDFNKDKNTEYSNFHKINKLFTEMKLHENKPDDYYFVVIGDTRNMIRSEDLTGFNHIAKHIIYAKDKNGNNIYDKISFIVHMGDIVYEGAVKQQWHNLKKAFSKKDYFGKNYPYIKLLAKDKPIFPVLGNHEIMKFRVKKETKYKNLSISNKGLEHFKDFFDWDKFMKNPDILFPIPGKLKKEIFDQICKRLEKEEFANLEKHYILKSDNNYHIRLFQDVINDYRNSTGLTGTKTLFLDPTKKSEVIEDLQKVFIKLGYNTLPVLNSDNMILYAFEINDLIYIVFDSMARGWQYKTFSELKKSVYHQKNKQHYLNLFTKSDLNGQYEFFKAVIDYAEKSGKTIVPFMHHSPFNSVDDIDGNGIEYNLKLMLGVEYKKKKNNFTFNKNISEHTFFDDLIFFGQNKSENELNIDHIFTSCVHYFQKFTLETDKGNQIKNKIKWYITGGGGGELATKYNDKKLKYSEMLYNKKLENTAVDNNNDNILKRSIKITKNEVKKDYNFLVVHVRNSKITDVTPHFIKRTDVRLKKPLINITAKVENYVYYSPISTSSLVSLRVGSWGLEKIMPMLAFVTWDPSIGIGYLHYDINGENSDMNSLTQTDLFKFTFHFSNFKEITLSLLGITAIVGGFDIQRAYLSFGFEGPLLYNFFSHLKEPIPKILKKFSFGLRYLIPLNVRDTDNKDFGKDINWSWNIQLSIL